jgi:hypothetical protein
LVYRDVNNHISDIWGQSPTPGSYQDLNTVVAGAPEAQGDPVLVTLPSVMHIIYRDINNHIADISYNFATWLRTWTYTDLSANCPASTGSPSGVEFLGRLNVFYRFGGTIYRVWPSLQTYQFMDLNHYVLPTVASWANGDPFSLTFSSPPQMHVFYRDANDHISDFWCGADTVWHYSDLHVSAQPTPVPALGNPCAVVFSGPGGDNQLHVVYRDVNNHISDIWGAAGTPPATTRYQDLNVLLPSAPAAKGNPFCYTVAADPPMLVVTYVDINDHIAFLYYPYGQTWNYADLGTQSA